MKLYKLTQSSNNNYDTFDSLIVAANNEDEARLIHPNGEDVKWGSRYSTWAYLPEDVKVTLIGEADSTILKGIVLSSFNAG